MAKSISARSHAESLHNAIMACLEAMTHLTGKGVKPDDPEPEALVDLRRAAEALPDMADDPFIGSSFADLPAGEDATSWHDVVYQRAKDWAQRLTKNLSDPKRQELRQLMVMPPMPADSKKLKGLLLVEMNRVRIEQRLISKQQKRGQSASREPQRKRQKAVAQMIMRPVELRGRAHPPVVNGKQKEKPLTSPQYDVVGILLTVGEKGLTKDELVENSKHADARGILRRLAQSDPDWHAVIRFPGKPHGRYRIS